MRTPDWETGDPFYGGFVFVGGTVGMVVSGNPPLLVGFGLLVGIVDWIEFRGREQSQGARGVALTMLVLAVLFGVLAVPGIGLTAYFALLAGVFFLQAVRSVIVTESGPTALFRRGYPSLIGLSLVCSALADGLRRFRWVLVVLLAALFLFRNLYARW